MYTHLCYKLFYVASRFAGTFGACGFLFDPATKTYYATKRSKQHLIWMFFLFIGISIFWSFRTLQIFLFQGGNSNKYFHITYGFTFVALIETTGLFILNWKHDHLMHFMNQVLLYFRTFQCQWMPGYNPNKAMTSRILDIVLLIGIAFYGSAPFMTMTHYLLFPETPIFLPTLLPDEWSQSRVVYWSNLIFVVYYGSAIWLTMLTVSVFTSTYTLSIVPLVRREFRANFDGYLTKSTLRSPTFLTHEYTCVQLMHKQMIEIIGLYIFFLQGAFSQFILFCNITVILNWEVLDVPTRMLLCLWSVSVQVILVVGLEMSGRFHEHAKKTLKSWKFMNCSSKQDKKFLNKFRKGCSPLKIGAEGVFTIKRLSVLKFLRAIVKGTFRAILTLDKK